MHPGNSFPSPLAGMQRSKRAPRRPAQDPTARRLPLEARARTQRRRERSRDEILEAARSIVDSQGLAALTMDQVAAAVGLTKAALYYYFPSKDALLHDLHYRAFETMSQRLHTAVQPTRDGAAALRALIRETVEQYAPRMDDYRLAYLQPQLAPASLAVGPEQLARLRPLNDLAFGGAAERLSEGPPGRAIVPPRLLAFVAHLAALGVLTMKGLVEAFDDPLLYSDEELIEALARVFEAASRP